LPQRPLPHVPIIRHPTPRQTQAAKRIITGAIRHAVGPGGSGADRLERRRQVEQELRSTGPGYQLLRAARHYARWERRHTEMAAGLSALQALPPPREPAALHRGLLYGFDATTRPPTRTEIRAIGRGVLQDRMVRDRVSPGVRKSLQGRGLAAVLAQTSLGSPSAENQFLKSAASDVGALATGPFIGGYEIGAGAYEAASAGAGVAARNGCGGSARGWCRASPIRRRASLSCTATRTRRWSSSGSIRC
jgi:GNAT superfamily N-acetyltransferase